MSLEGQLYNVLLSVSMLHFLASVNIFYFFTEFIIENPTLCCFLGFFLHFSNGFFQYLGVYFTQNSLLGLYIVGYDAKLST